MLFCASLLTSCAQTKESIKPQLDYAVQDKYLKQLQPIFPALTTNEMDQLWGKEYFIGVGFAKKLDLYQAITSFKRADILIPENNVDRKAEIQYQIVSCYYLGKKYYEVIDTFEDSLLASTTRNFIGFHDLLIMLFESYLKTGQPERAHWLLRSMKKHFPKDAEKLQFTSAILEGDLLAMKELVREEELQQDENAFQLISNNEEKEEVVDLSYCRKACGEILTTYDQYKKSPLKAQIFNAILPGAGYLYLGQKQSAFTAFSLNSLFIGAAAYFFHSGNIPAGIITLSFESGWYLGGIAGVKEQTRLYNERLFETHAHYHLRDNKLFPILMLNHGF